MIFVILGTEKFSFNRLVQKIDILVENDEIKDSVFIQLGSCTYEPKYYRWKRFLSFGDMCKHIKNAKLVIAHAGAGTTLLCLQYGKKPILVPRQKRFKEHVDDHQIVFAKRMKKAGLVEVAFEVDELYGVIYNYQNRGKIENTFTQPQSIELTEYLNNLLDNWKIAKIE